MDSKYDNLNKNIDLWKEKLLDISLNNQAVNFKKRKTSTVEVLFPSIETFLNDFISSKKVVFAEPFDNKNEEEELDLFEDEVDVYYWEEKETITVQGIQLEKKERYSSDELRSVINAYNRKNKKNNLFSSYDGLTQRRALRLLMKNASTFKEENAISVLYFAIGFIKWFEGKDSNISHSAPLLFVQAELTQESFDAPFMVNFEEAELLVNDSIIRRLMQDFNLDITYEFNNGENSVYEQYLSYKQYVEQKFTDERWKINDNIFLGIFSFSRINMVRDLEENRNNILANPLLQQISGINEEIFDSGFVNEKDIDEIINPNNYYHALEADSSQEIAIQSAINGKSFVLQGPPGTGKSQTITNIITELIANGKKVLFVAEKKAALDVVYNNLKKVGLNDFALPIHNTKLNKKEIVYELANTLEKGLTSNRIDQGFSDNAINHYKISKDYLNTYANNLISKRAPLNKSAYELYGILLKYQNYPHIQFKIDNVTDVDDETLFRQKTYINNLYQTLKTLNFSPENDAFFGLKADELSINDKELLFSQIEKMILCLEGIREDAAKISYFDISNENFIENLVHFGKILEHLSLVETISKSIIDLENIENEIISYSRLLTLKEQIISTKELLFLNFDKEILNIEGDKLFRVVRSKRHIFKRIFSKQYKNIKKEILLYKKVPKIRYKGLLLALEQLVNIQNCSKEFDEIIEKLIFKISHYELDEIKQTLRNLIWYRDFKNLLDTVITPSNSFRVALNGDILHVVTNVINKKEPFCIMQQQYQAKLENLEKTLSDLQSNFYFQEVTFATLNANKLDMKLLLMESKKETINSYLLYNRARYVANKNGLEDFTLEIRKAHLQQDFYEIYLRRFYTLLVDEYLNSSFPHFDGKFYDEMRKEFAKGEKTIQKMAEYNVENKIVDRIPNYEGIEGFNSEIIILRSEANKSRRIMPFRQLFNQIPNLIMKLKPCLMMSPLSVSSYLRNSDIHFDVVIFDEASQVKPENAIGALFRADQYIIVGDREQLPPTNFFQNIDYDEFEEMSEESMYDTSGYDSILELASAHLGNIRLKWHYRSKFEELIYPSNMQIYGDLITFPSQSLQNEYEGVQFIFANGIYVNNQNEAEADKVIELLMKIYDKFETNRSIGVVTFNIRQQTLIERKINNLRRKHPEYEPLFSAELKEPFFIKNIETVQGDERDIIIMSVLYGPDGRGVIRHNFGPLNQENGYRRLNVAVTRAKIGLLLVTSLRGTDIDLNRAKSRGAKFLKFYLNYAEFGPDEKVDEINDFAISESPFEDDVYNELIKLGYTVKKQVGSSGYRIDLAIVNPRVPSNYILAIECDGATYHSSKSARDRDRLRQDVLEARGWVVYRIWSTDWIKNKQQQILKLQKFIENLTSSSRNLPKKEEVFIPVEKVERPIKQIKFDLYPNHDDVYNESLSARTYVNVVYHIILKTSPIAFDEIKRIVPPLWDRKLFSSFVAGKFRNIIDELVSKRKIIEKNGFFISISSEINFRMVDENSTRRKFVNIHREELSAGILKIVEEVETIDKKTLFGQIINYCGYASLSQSMNEYLESVLKYMAKQGKIFIEDNLVKLVLTTDSF